MQRKTQSWKDLKRAHISCCSRCSGSQSMLLRISHHCRFVSTKEETQIYGAILPDSLTNPEIKETKAYKTYIGFASGATPPKKARTPKLTIAPTRGVVIRETPEVLVSKKKEKVDVAKGKGIELLSDMALNEDAQFAEVQKNSMRDFHKTHPSGSGTATKPTPSATIIKPSVTNEGTGVKLVVPNVTEEESSESKTESWGNDEDDNNNDQDPKSDGSDQEKDIDDDKTQSDNENKLDSEHETNESGSESDQEEEEKIKDVEEEKEDIVKTPSNDFDDKDEIKVADKAEGDEDEEMDYTTSQLYDDVDIRLNESVDTDKGFVQEEGTNASHNIGKRKDDPLKTQVTALVDEHLDARLGGTRDEFMNFLSASITARITEQVKNRLPQILLKEVSNFASPILIDKMDKIESYLAAPEHRDCYEGSKKSYDLDKTFFSTYGKVYSLKRSRKEKDKDEDPCAGSDRGLKKRKTSKDAKPTKEEPEFEVVDYDMPHDQEENQNNDDEPKESLNINSLTQETLLGLAFRLLKGIRSNYAELEFDFEECYKALSEKLDWENPEGGDYPFDLTKPLPLVKIRKRQKKHGYGYMHEIVVRRADNELYRFKEGDFPRLRINDIEDMLLLVV
nr:hypothetical protein [Tanacetum cinerariifolium]GEW87889.1 hypothetical protein [Tanacetum cinerariifolium]